MDEFGASHGGLSCSCSRGPESIRTPLMVPGEAVWAVVCATFVRDAQAILPDPHDKPTPDPDDDLEDDPENEPKDEPEDEVEDDPKDEPDTLYFGRDDKRARKVPREFPPLRRPQSLMAPPRKRPPRVMLEPTAAERIRTRST